MATDDIGAIVKDAARSLAAGRARLAELARQIAEVQKTRDEVFSAPMTKADTEDAIKRRIDFLGGQFRGLFGARMKASRVSYAASLHAATGKDFIHPFQDAYSGPHAVIDERSLCAYFAPQLIEGVKRMLEELEWPKDAIPNAERLRLLGEADDKLSELHAQRLALSRALGDDA